MKEHLILRVVTKLMLPFILLFGFYIQLHGEISPGGGFQAGIVLASAFILHGLIFGLEAVQKILPRLAVIRLSAFGLLIYTGVGAATLVMQGELLNYSVLSDNPIQGQHLGIWLVELGVMTTVTSVMILIYYIFGGHRPEAGR